MTDSKRYLDWFNKASIDYRSAQILFENEGDYGIVAFHCQQAIEKLLKAFILMHEKRLVDGHSLVFLCRRAMEFDQTIVGFLKDCAYVNQFYIETRYPADIPMVMEKDEAQECLSIVEAIFEHLALT